jgi:Yip1-like protein
MQGIWGGGALAQPCGVSYLRPAVGVVGTHTVPAVSRRNAMALVDRVKNMLLKPNDEWAVIEKELTDTGTLYRTYIIPLAAITPICSAIGWAVFGLSIPFAGSVRLPITTALTSGAIEYVLTLIFVFIFALIIDGLAPTFGGTKNQVQALKVAAYASTASWVGGVFTLIPALSIISLIFSCYSLYLLYAGLSPLMKSPKDKAMPYTIVVILVGIVLAVVAVALRKAFLPSANLSM